MSNNDHTPKTDSPEQIKERIRQTAEHESFKRRLAEEAAVRKVFTEHPTKFKATQEQILQSIGTVQFRDGVPYAVNSGKTLSEALDFYSKINSHAIAATPLEAANHEDSIRSKADLKDATQASAYITQHGYEKYAALPAKPEQAIPVDPEEMTLAQYKALPVSKRSALSVTHPGLIARIHQREQEYIKSQRLAGVPLDKIKR
jgi:hypothetical protein